MKITKINHNRIDWKGFDEEEPYDFEEHYDVFVVEETETTFLSIEVHDTLEGLEEHQVMYLFKYNGKRFIFSSDLDTLSKAI